MKNTRMEDENEKDKKTAEEQVRELFKILPNPLYFIAFFLLVFMLLMVGRKQLGDEITAGAIIFLALLILIYLFVWLYKLIRKYKKD